MFKHQALRKIIVNNIFTILPDFAGGPQGNQTDYSRDLPWANIPDNP